MLCKSRSAQDVIMAPIDRSKPGDHAAWVCGDFPHLICASSTFYSGFSEYKRLVLHSPSQICPATPRSGAAEPSKNRLKNGKRTQLDISNPRSMVSWLRPIDRCHHHIPSSFTRKPAASVVIDRFVLLQNVHFWF